MIVASILLYLPLLLLLGVVFGAAFFAELQSTGSVDALILLMPCIVLFYMLPMSAILAFTHRAIVVERLGVFAAVRRGKDVFLEKIAPTFGLAILVLAYAIPIILVAGVAWALHPLAGLVVIAFVVPFIVAFQSATFTLAFREWTGLRAEVLPDEGQLALA